MRGALEQILYIGQSKDLRTRLAYYKNANPDRVPRRLIRLVHEVETISWERCLNAEAARARELELLRLHRPKFNRADTGPQFFHYIEWRCEADQLSIRIHFEDRVQPQGAWRGPIRGKTISAAAMVALSRLWQIAANQTAHCSQLPLTPKSLTHVHLPGPSDWLQQATEFIRGNSPDLLSTLINSASPQAEPLLRQLQEADSEILLSWFRALSEERDLAE